jgi:hypothetical protein
MNTIEKKDIGRHRKSRIENYTLFSIYGITGLTIIAISNVLTHQNEAIATIYGFFCLALALGYLSETRK